MQVIEVLMPLLHVVQWLPILLYMLHIFSSNLRSGFALITVIAVKIYSTAM